MKIEELMERTVGFFGKERNKGEREPEHKEKEDADMKRLKVSYKTGAFPIKKALETKIKKKAHALGAKDIDHTMSSDNIRSLIFDVPKNHVKELRSFAHAQIRDYEFEIKD